MKKFVVTENGIVYGNVSEKTGKLGKGSVEVTNEVLTAVAEYLCCKPEFEDAGGIAMYVIEGDEDIVITAANPEKQIVLSRDEYMMLASEAGRI